MSRICECGRAEGQCVKGDLDHCPADDDLFDDDGDDEGWPAECGIQANGRCSLAGTEWCDWSCPVADQAAHNRRRIAKAEKPLPLFATTDASTKGDGNG